MSVVKESNTISSTTQATSSIIEQETLVAADHTTITNEELSLGDYSLHFLYI